MFRYIVVLLKENIEKKNLCPKRQHLKSFLKWGKDISKMIGTNINQVRTRGVVASAHDGIISLFGLDDGEVVKFFAADGKYLGSTVAANGAASYAVSESLVIAKVGKNSIKIAMK